MSTTKFTDAFQAVVRREADGIADLLNATDMEQVTKISVAEFEQKFLPLLKNIGEGFDSVAWINEVSHPFVRLQVYDESGVIKYDIPPFFAQQKTTEVEGYRIVDQTDRIKSLNSDSPRLAMNFIANMLHKFSDNAFDNKQAAEEMSVALNQVFNDYDLPLIPTSGSHQFKTAANIKKVSDYEYEDF